MCELEQVEAYLPDVVQEMVSVIGLPATEKVIQHFGGVDFRFSLGKWYFPKMVEVIGKESADSLRRYFKREKIYIPRCDRALRALRNARFKAEFEALKREQALSGNMAMIALCPKYGISERYGWEIVRERLPCATAQQGLF
ncbi:hypothetical protein A4G19_03670 [Pasteurellaceae bacterium Macca]|nr:hypothetical protein [Pasteurellaceae bacterium Macca]